MSTRRFLLRMIVFLLVVMVIAAALFIGLKHAFLANPALNGLILGVLLAGIILNFRQVLSLQSEILWLDAYQKQSVTGLRGNPRLLAPLAVMLGDRERFSLSPLALRSVLDGISSRLDESRDISRYFIGLAIFLGLLGTFWGLSQTVGSIATVIQSLSVEENGDIGGVFDTLKQGLHVPLAGMGTAFSSSLLGLSGSLILGFLDLQATQAQNTFYNDLEEWLSERTRLGNAPLGEIAEDSASVPAYVNALLEQTADNLNNLQRTLMRGEENRAATDQSIRTLSDRLSVLTDQMRTEQNLMLRLAETQMEMKPLLTRLTEVSSRGMDEITRQHIRNIDTSLTRMLQETSVGREEVVREIRSEFKMLAKTMTSLVEEN